MYILIGFIIGVLIVYLCMLPRIKKTVKINEDAIKANQELEEENSLLNINIKKLYETEQTISFNIKELLREKENILNHINELRENAESSAQAFYDKSMEVAQINFENAANELAQKYQDSKAACEEEYFIAQKELSENLSKALMEYQRSANKAERALKDLENSVSCAVEAAKRKEELKDKEKFYKINLAEIDLQEIEMIKKVVPYVRDKEAVNKVIWKCYYEKPTSDLIGRVIGTNVVSGIYKITHIDSERCYVGQAVDLASRWRQHIKRGLGAEPATRNKLYPAMMEYGPENFTFEVIELCDREQLDEREDFWQDYFKAKEFGYSIK